MLLACASDDSDANQGEAESAAQATPDAAVDAAAMASESSKDGDAKQPPDTRADTDKDTTDTPKQQDESGAAAVMRYDGTWRGTTSQDKPISFKILNRFLAHVEIEYEAGASSDSDAGDCDTSDGEAKLSAMLPMRGTGFMLMKETEAFTLQVTAQFPSDTSAEGEFSVKEKGGCQAEASGTWKASKP